jgi:hypothetical protein
MRVIPSQLETAAPVPPQNHELREVRRAGRSIDAWAQDKCHVRTTRKIRTRNFSRNDFRELARLFFFRVVRGRVLVILRERREQEDLLLDRNEKSRSSRRNAPE